MTTGLEAIFAMIRQYEEWIALREEWLAGIPDKPENKSRREMLIWEINDYKREIASSHEIIRNS